MSDAEHNSETLKDVVWDLKRTLECPVCMDVVKHPFRLCATGHLMCVGCVNTTTSCPTCQAALTTENPICINQLLECLPHDCRYSVNGCEQIVQDGNDHEKYCGFRLVKCRDKYCTQEISVKMLADHYKTGCHQASVLINEKITVTWSQFNQMQSRGYNLVKLFNCLFWVCRYKNVEEQQVEFRFEAIPIGKLDSNYYLTISFKNGSFKFKSTVKAYIPAEDEPSDQTEDVRSGRMSCMKIPQELVSHLIDWYGDLIEFTANY